MATTPSQPDPAALKKKLGAQKTMLNSISDAPGKALDASLSALDPSVRGNKKLGYQGIALSPKHTTIEGATSLRITISELITGGIKFAFGMLNFALTCVTAQIAAIKVNNEMIKTKEQLKAAEAAKKDEAEKKAEAAKKAEKAPGIKAESAPTTKFQDKLGKEDVKARTHP